MEENPNSWGRQGWFIILLGIGVFILLRLAGA
jgi:hypothetical protein